MLLTNLTSSDYYVGHEDYLLSAGGTLTIPDTVYNNDNAIAAAANSLVAGNKASVTSPPSGFPRTTSPTTGGYSPGGTDVALADGGTGTSLVDPNADKIMFWDDSAGVMTWLTPGTNLTITGTTIDAAGGGGGGGLVLLEQHTASASGSLDFTSFISSTYDEYMFELIGILPGTSAADLCVRMGSGGGPTFDTASNYVWSGYRFAQGGAAFAGSGSANLIALTANGGVRGSTASTPLNGSCKLFSPQSSTLSKYVMGQASWVDNSTAILGSVITGIWLPTTVMTGIQFLFSAGVITSGTIRAYGIVKS